MLLVGKELYECRVQCKHVHQCQDSLMHTGMDGQEHSNMMVLHLVGMVRMLFDVVLNGDGHVFIPNQAIGLDQELFQRLNPITVSIHVIPAVVIG
jgi:hypothetical protein